MSRFRLQKTRWTSAMPRIMAHLQLLYRNGPTSHSSASLSRGADTSSSNRQLTQTELASIARQTAEPDAKLDGMFAAHTPPSNYAARRRAALGMA